MLAHVARPAAFYLKRCSRTQGVRPRSRALPNPAEFAILILMIDKSPALESLTAQERIVLMGRLWDSLDPAAAAPLSPALAAELARREAQADADPDAGIPWDALRGNLQALLR